MLYRCPFCHRDTSVFDDRISKDAHLLSILNASKISRLHSTFIVCPNPQCQQASLQLSLVNENEFVTRKWQLLPESKAIPFPEYVPEQIGNAYEQAALIVVQSPKASATLSRRCLQGMLRDFWGVKSGRLFDEINSIQD